METPKEKVEDVRVRLNVKSGGLEIWLEGSVENILSKLDEAANLFKQALEKFSAGKVVEAVKPVEGEAEYPAIKPSRSTMENLQALFNTPWGQTPRSLSEVTKALEVNGVPDSPSNVTVYLKRLVARGFLRRIPKDGKYYYYRVPEASG